MTDPIKPADSLYKIMIVGGIVLAICFVIFPVLFFQRASMGILDERQAERELPVYEQFVKERLESIDKHKQEAIDKKTRLEAQLKKLNPESSEVEKLRSRIDEADRNIESKEKDSSELRLNLELKRKNAEHEKEHGQNWRRDSRVFMVAGCVTAFIFLLISFIGFWQWRKPLKLQARLIANNEIEEKPPIALPEVAESNPAQPIPVDVAQTTKPQTS
ncbi:MAG TPA: hypothetical protein VFZ22_02215 [Pyrinomonadaceae bacterium]|nr:hypothetical protein [Pyrinomonadaceae bacterium]